MKKITGITVHYQDGTQTRYDGAGTANLVRTQTKVDDLAPINWPWTTFVHAHLEIPATETADR